MMNQVTRRDFMKTGITAAAGTVAGCKTMAGCTIAS